MCMWWEHAHARMRAHGKSMVLKTHRQTQGRKTNCCYESFGGNTMVEVPHFSHQDGFTQPHSRAHTQFSTLLRMACGIGKKVKNKEDRMGHSVQAAAAG
jgi:hypothetical protein